MRIQRRVYGLLAASVLVLGALLAFAGCAKKEDESHTITVVRNIGSRVGFRRHWDAWKSTFEQQNPGWKMELVDIGDEDTDEFYKTRIANDSLPDIVFNYDLRKMVRSGLMQPIPDTFYDKFGIPRPRAYEGKRYTSQTGIQFQGMIINKKMWDSIGVTTPPTTWEAFVADLRKLKAKGYQALAFGGRDSSVAEIFLETGALNLFPYAEVPEGADTWTTLLDKGQVHFASDPIALKVLKNNVDLLSEFTEKGVASDGYTEEQRDFYSGKAATWMMGCWVGGDIEPNKVNFAMDYWPIPSMIGRKPAFYRTSYPYSGWAITSNASGEKYPMALKVLEALYDPKVYQLLLDGESIFPIAAKVPVKAPHSDWPPAQALYNKMAAVIKQYPLAVGSGSRPEDWAPTSYQSSVQRVMSEALSGDKDIKKLAGMLDDDWASGRKAAEQ